MKQQLYRLLVAAHRADGRFTLSRTENGIHWDSNLLFDQIGVVNTPVRALQPKAATAPPNKPERNESNTSIGLYGLIGL